MRLEPAPNRGPDPALRLRVVRPFHEEIRIAMEVVGRRECDRIDPILEHGAARCGKAGDSMREQSHELTKCGGGERAVVQP
jgi:hypothetical protein